MAGCRWTSSADVCGCGFGVEGGVIRFGDDGLDATLDRICLALLASPQPESRLVALELCVLTDGGVAVDGVRGARRVWPCLPS